MSSNLDNHKSSVRDIAKLFAEEKRLGTKAADLVNGTALTKCLEINEAFEVLGTPAEQRVAMLASTVFCADIRLVCLPSHAANVNNVNDGVSDQFRRGLWAHNL